MAYTIRETAKALGISEKTVRRKIQSGEIVARVFMGKFGRQYLIDAIPDHLTAIPVDRVDRSAPPCTSANPPEQAEVSTGQSTGAGVAKAVPSLEMQDLIRLVDRLQQENAMLHNRIGYLQAKLQDLEEARARALPPPKQAWWKFWKRGSQGRC